MSLHIQYDLIMKNTNKPLSFKFTLESPIDKKIDYEVMGNALDNILLKAKELNMPLDVEGKIYTVDFSVGSKNKYIGSADFRLALTFRQDYLQCSASRM